MLQALFRLSKKEIDLHLLMCKIPVSIRFSLPDKSPAFWCFCGRVLRKVFIPVFDHQRYQCMRILISERLAYKRFFMIYVTNLMRLV